MTNYSINSLIDGEKNENDENTKQEKTIKRVLENYMESNISTAQTCEQSNYSLIKKSSQISKSKISNQLGTNESMEIEKQEEVEGEIQSKIQYKKYKSSQIARGKDNISSIDEVVEEHIIERNTFNNIPSKKNSEENNECINIKLGEFPKQQTKINNEEIFNRNSLLSNKYRRISANSYNQCQEENFNFRASQNLSFNKNNKEKVIRNSSIKKTLSRLTSDLNKIRTLVERDNDFQQTLKSYLEVYQFQNVFLFSDVASKIPMSNMETIICSYEQKENLIYKNIIISTNSIFETNNSSIPYKAEHQQSYITNKSLLNKTKEEKDRIGFSNPSTKLYYYSINQYYELILEILTLLSNFEDIILPSLFKLNKSSLNKDNKENESEAEICENSETVSSNGKKCCIIF